MTIRMFAGGTAALVALGLAMPAAAQGLLSLRADPALFPAPVIAPAAEPLFAPGEETITAPAGGGFPEAVYRRGTVDGVEYWFAEDRSEAGIDLTPGDNSATWTLQCDITLPIDISSCLAVHESSPAAFWFYLSGNADGFCILAHDSPEPALAQVDDMAEVEAPQGCLIEEIELMATLLAGTTMRFSYIPGPGAERVSGEVPLAGLTLAGDLIHHVWGMPPG